jgi:hypothetical protein
MTLKQSLFALMLLCSISAEAQEEYKRALCLYPLNQQIAWRGNNYRKFFSDFKVGMTFSTLPFFTLEYNRCRRFIQQDQFSNYLGLGITLDSYVPGVQIPIGFEIVPLQQMPRFSLITELNPKITFGPTNFLNINLNGHIGVAYYFKSR